MDLSRDVKGAGVEAGVVLTHPAVLHQAAALEKVLPSGLPEIRTGAAGQEREGLVGGRGRGRAGKVVWEHEGGGWK